MRAPGDIGSENADMSSDKKCEKTLSPKIQGFLRKANPRRGESAPKARSKDVVDGKQVNIPVPDEM